MSSAVRVPPAKLARMIEWVRHHLYRLHQRLAPAPVVMAEMLIAGWMSQALTVAADLGVADARAGFRMTQVVQTASPLSIVEATAV